MFKELKESKPVCLENSEGEGGMSRGWRGMKKSRTRVSCPSVGIDSRVSEQILNGFMHMQGILWPTVDFIKILRAALWTMEQREAREEKGIT